MADDIVSATTTSITEKVLGVDRTFVYLNTYNKAQIIREMRAQAKAKMLDNLKTAGASPEQIAVDLNAFDADPPSDWIDFVTEYEGMTYALQLSLDKSYPGEGKKISQEHDLPDGTVTKILFAICALKAKEPDPVPPKAPDTRTYGDGGDAENPTFSPLTYGKGEGATPTL